MIKATSLQITGLFARLKNGRLNTDQAMDMVLSLTDALIQKPINLAKQINS